MMAELFCILARALHACKDTQRVAVVRWNVQNPKRPCRALSFAISALSIHYISYCICVFLRVKKPCNVLFLFDRLRYGTGAGLVLDMYDLHIHDDNSLTTYALVWAVRYSIPVTTDGDNSWLPATCNSFAHTQDHGHANCSPEEI